VRLETQPNDNGKDKFVSAELRDDGKIHIDGTKGRFVADAGIMPTNHWNPEVVSRSRVLNSINGSIDSVTIEDQGEETVETSTGPIQARRYVYSGELENEVWYDSQGQWVKMRFVARDGSTVDYLCETCGENRSGEVSVGG
ncbi:MAG: DUF6134 family protein, partial [Rhodospirillales bacterium]|nr:DUF6134 family protein [Rhodospirillales bacterium]